MFNYYFLSLLVTLILLIQEVSVLCEIEEYRNSSIFRSFQTEEDALKVFESNFSRNVIADDLITSISKGWWRLSKKLILKTHEQGIDLSKVVRSTELVIRKELDELTRLLNKKHSEIATLSPAFQWAQSSDHVYLNIKFTYRWNAPGALRIENKTVSIHENVFFFSALGSHSHEKKRYVLKLELFDEVDSELSEWSFGSVGKLSCTLVKKRPNNKWPRLLKDEKLKIPNMHIWWEMKEKHEESINVSNSNNSKEIESIGNHTAKQEKRGNIQNEEL